MDNVKNIVVAFLVLICASQATASDACDQMRDFGIASFNAYKAGATKSELFDRAKSLAEGDQNIADLLINVVHKSLEGKTTGEAGRKSYAYCKQIGF